MLQGEADPHVSGSASNPSETTLLVPEAIGFQTVLGSNVSRGNPRQGDTSRGIPLSQDAPVSLLERSTHHVPMSEDTSKNESDKLEFGAWPSDKNVRSLANECPQRSCSLVSETPRICGGDHRE